MVSDLGCSYVDYTENGNIYVEYQCCEQYVFLGVVLFTQCHTQESDDGARSAWLAGRGRMIKSRA